MEQNVIMIKKDLVIMHEIKLKKIKRENMEEIYIILCLKKKYKKYIKKITVRPKNKNKLTFFLFIV